MSLLPYRLSVLACLMATGVSLVIITQAAGIQVSPLQAEILLDGEKQENLQIQVANPSFEPQSFLIVADEYPEAIIAQPQDFSLFPGEMRTVNIVFSPNRLPLNNFKTRLSVVGSPISKKDFTISAGAKIPLLVSRKQNDGLFNSQEWPIQSKLMLALLLVAASTWLAMPKEVKIK